MDHTREKVFIVLAALILLLAACSTNQVNLQNTSWIVSSINVAGEPFSLETERLPTLEIGENNQVGGFAGCNSFGGEIQFNPDGTLQVSSLFQTEMWCEDGMQVESTYMSALAAGTRYRLNDGNLIISSDDSLTELVFAPARQE